MNIVIVRGRLSRPPERRDLPSGDSVVAYEVTVERSGARAESVPVVWHGAPANATDLEPETAIVAVGRVRRRFFRARGVTQSRTEVVADAVVPARQTKRVGGLVSAAVAAVTEALVDRTGSAGKARGAGPSPPG